MSERGIRKKLVGMVVSDKMDKTIVVRVDRRFQHPVYGKYLTRSEKYKAHDEKNEFLIGDTVELEESRPVSKQKRWRVRRLVNRPASA